MSRPPRLASPSRARLGRALTLGGYFGLLGLVLAWFVWIAPPERLPRVLPLAALALPLLFPLRGLLHGRRYTHQWTSFLALPYFAIGVDAWFNPAPGRAWLGAAMTLCALALFAGTVIYARYTPSAPSPTSAVPPAD